MVLWAHLDRGAAARARGGPPALYSFSFLFRQKGKGMGEMREMGEMGEIFLLSSGAGREDWRENEKDKEKEEGWCDGKTLFMAAS
ncbi:MAG: hypothetical protein LBC18_00465 [Opitutaceae bacterium]|jgi:hypothetical protein|nr:hypothetical protein [Opitutaceae bacterium]